MGVTFAYPEQELQKATVVMPRWQRIPLLLVLGYEGVGALVGGSLLMIKPDGRLMDMPVELMHGFFPDFFIPGIILFALGILNIFAFVSVVRRSATDWFMAILALGALAIWFVVEIIILQELHWLHLMWGYPVYVGIVFTIPLIVARYDSTQFRRALLLCGAFSTIWYIAINVYVPLQYEGYSVATFTVSELSAIGSPTRILWVLLCIPYAILYVAFGWGVLQAASGNRHLRVAGMLILLFCLFNFYWPPMNMRGNAMALTDTLHITWAMVTLTAMLFTMGYGAAALGKRFRIYTVATFVIFIGFGMLMGTEAPGLAKNLPTPHLGMWERVNMAAFFVWVIVFSIALWKRDKLAAKPDS